MPLSSSAANRMNSPSGLNSSSGLKPFSSKSGSSPSSSSATGRVGKQQFDDLEFDDARSGEHCKQEQPKGTYAVYKEATMNFRDGLAKLLPKGFRLAKVYDFKLGADQVLQQSLDLMQHSGDQNSTSRQSQKVRSASNKRRQNVGTVAVHQSVFDNLNTSIRRRQEQARRHGDSDVGHRYILSVLEYCRDVLHLSNAVVRSRTQRDERAGCKGRYDKTSGSIMQLSDEKDEQDNDIWNLCNVYDDKSVHQRDFEVPTAPPLPVLLSSSLSGASLEDEDLIQAGDRFQCIAFLETMDRLMGMLRNKYDGIKLICIQDFDGDQLLSRLMEGAIAANLCMDCVKSTWAELSLEHPHVRSFYDLLAVVFLMPDLLQQDAHNDVISFTNERHPHMLTHLVGDVVEACFAVDGLDTSKALNAYGSKTCLPDGGWEKESLLEDGELLARNVCDMVFERDSHKIRESFLSGYKFIGDRRCILNTQKVMQQVFAYLDQSRGPVNDDNIKQLAKAAGNTFDFLWHEDKNPARQVRCDLDYTFAGEVLPELIISCLCAPSNPGINAFVPLWHSLEQYTMNQFGSPIPIDVTFGFHALLISIMALQGNNHARRLGLKAKSAFEEHMDQLKKSSRFFFADIIPDCVFETIEEVARPAWRPLSETSILNAYWNPLLAGSFCLYGVYTGLMAETPFLRGNLRSVLHLYNALRSRNLVEEIDYLNRLGAIFSETPVIWTAKGGFAKNYLLGNGVSIRDVSFVIDCLKSNHGIQTHRYRFANHRSKSVFLNPTKVQILRAHDFSYGYQAIYCKNYSVIDSDTANETR